jgi:hypothetical protein
VSKKHKRRDKPCRLCGRYPSAMIGRAGNRRPVGPLAGGLCERCRKKRPKYVDAMEHRLPGSFEMGKRR